MTAQRPRPARESGIAVVTALLVVALATILAAELAWELHVDIRRTEANLLRSQATQIALAGELIAAKVLRDDFEDDQKSQHCDDPSEDWAREITFPIEGGAIRGQLSDLQGRFNLNNLLKGGVKDERALELFGRLLEQLGFEPGIAPKVLDWIDPDQVEEFDGAEDSVYTARTPAYRAANTWFTTTSELLAVDGFVDPEDPSLERFEALERYVTALPSGQKINVNFAEEPLLLAMAGTSGAANAESLTANRPYCSILSAGDGSGEERAFMDDAKDIVDPNFASDYLDVGTNFFQLKVLVTLGTSQLTMYSLLYRDTNGIVSTKLRYFDTK